MSDISTVEVAKALDDVHQLANALAMFRKGVAQAPAGSAALYLHRASGLMEMVVHDLNSVAGNLSRAAGLDWQDVDTGWAAMTMAESHGQGHHHGSGRVQGPHGQGCGCGCDHHHD